MKILIHMSTFMLNDHILSFNALIQWNVWKYVLWKTVLVLWDNCRYVVLILHLLYWCWIGYIWLLFSLLRSFLPCTHQQTFVCQFILLMTVNDHDWYGKPVNDPFVWMICLYCHVSLHILHTFFVIITDGLSSFEDITHSITLFN